MAVKRRMRPVAPIIRQLSGPRRTWLGRCRSVENDPKRPLSIITSYRGHSDLRLWMKIALMLAATLSLLAAKEAVAGCIWINPVSPRFFLRGGEAIGLQTDLIWKRCSLGLTWDADRHDCVGEIAKVGLDDAFTEGKGGWLRMARAVRP